MVLLLPRTLPSSDATRLRLNQTYINCTPTSLHHLLKQSIFQSINHSIYQSSTGNRETLETIPKSKGIDVRKELLKFHKQWYSANIMTLVVMGKGKNL